MSDDDDLAAGAAGCGLALVGLMWVALVGFLIFAAGRWLWLHG